MIKSLLTSLLLFVTLSLAHAAPRVLQIRAPLQVSAGAAWSIDVTIASGAAGETIHLALYNGLGRWQQALVTGTGGVARWDIPPQTTTHAGQSMITAVYGEETIRRSIRVVPGLVESVDLLTTANAVPAYEQGEAMWIALLRDAFGNPPSIRTRASILVRYPSGMREEFRIAPDRAGLAWMGWKSLGEPGRVRVEISAQNAHATLEVAQIPSVAAAISLGLYPLCVIADGRERIELTAQVFDSTGMMVVDGTLITFMFDEGYGYGQVFNGVATINLAAPIVTGVYNYWARVGDVESSSVALEVVDDRCS